MFNQFQFVPQQETYVIDVQSAIQSNDVKKLAQICSDRPYMHTQAIFLITTKKQLGNIIATYNLLPIHLAAFYDSFECFLYLLAHGSDIKASSACNTIPLHYACISGSKEIAFYILSKDPEEAKSVFGLQYESIYLSIYSNSPAILKRLLDLGADLNGPQNDAGKPFNQCLVSQNYDCLMILLDHKCKTEVASKPLTPLMLAILSGMNGAIEPLIDRGQDPCYVNVNGETALSAACKLGSIEAVKLLCSRMTEIEITSTYSRVFPSICTHAILSKNLEILEIVLEKGCKVNRFDGDHKLPVYSLLGFCDSSSNLPVKMLKALIAHGFEVNIRETPKSLRFLEYIVIKYFIVDCTQLIECLLSNGADPTLPMPDGGCLLDYANGLKKSSNPTEKSYYGLFKHFFPSNFQI